MVNPNEWDTHSISQVRREITTLGGATTKKSEGEIICVEIF
jgi:hypothetical protein